MTQELPQAARPHNMPRDTQYLTRRTCAACGTQTKNYLFLEGTGTYICTIHTRKEGTR